MKITYDDLDLLFKLHDKHRFNDEISCFDYVESIEYSNEHWIVKIFIEPVGVIETRNKKLDVLLQFWLKIFQTQPSNWNYAKAGGYIMTKATRMFLDIDKIELDEFWG